MSKFKKRIQIVKSSGHIEPFSAVKLQRSLRRSGLTRAACEDITHKVTKELKDGMSTKAIYRKAFNLVRHESTVGAVHYSLKRAILALGPSGYEFERFASRYFQALGFDTKVGVTLQGKYVKHEVDVIASSAKELFYAECKFHNTVGRVNDIKVVLYVKSRWDDLKAGPTGEKLDGFYLVSNTSFSSDAIQYAQGTGLKLLGVNAPADETFIQQVIRLKLYPITSLRRLKKHILGQLLGNGVILCSELLTKRSFLTKLGMTDEEIDLIFSDVHQLIKKSL